MLMILLCLLLFSFFFLGYCLQYYHILSLLICLEGVMLSVIVFYFYVSLMYSASSFLFLLLLIFAASEASFGLSLLISVLRLHGNDLIKSISSIKV